METPYRNSSTEFSVNISSVGLRVHDLHDRQVLSQTDRESRFGKHLGRTGVSDTVVTPKNLFMQQILQRFGEMGVFNLFVRQRGGGCKVFMDAI